MKINAKLLVVAFILAIFSIGAVAAGENMTGSSDFTQVPHEHVVSVSEPTVPEVETTDLQTSADDTTYSSSSGSDEKINVTDSSKGSLKKGNENSLLGVANDEDVLGSRIIYPSGTTFLDIKNAINSADTNDTVDLNGSIYKGSYTPNLNANKQITIQNGVIDGSNVVNGEVISFTGVTLKNVHFTNFHYNTPGNYPRIFSFADCILENVKFSNSSNDVYTGMFSALQRVRAVNVSYDGIVSGTCVGSIKNSNLTNVNFTNSRVTDNPKDFDTGQFTVITDTILDNCNFINTSSQQHSGAICMARGANTVINSNFINCTAWVGGAIYAHGDFAEGNKKYIIENCKFINCHAEEEGGALGLSHNNMDVKNCEFINNTATKGAGIMVGGINHPKGIDGDNSHGHNITVENCIFTNNNASLEGGAVHISGDNNSIINSQFYFNEAHEGGAVHITGDNSLAKDCYFDDNLAVGGNGSAIFVHGDNASVIDSEFYNHQSSRGTVFIRGDHAAVEDSTFEHNIASRGGAGVYVDGNYTYMDGNTFKDNNATIHGGAIHSHGDHVKILNSFFYDNHATPHIENKDQGLGGAIYIRGDHNEISFSTFEGNTARNGSAIYNKGLNLTLNDDYFHNNQAFSYLLFTVIKPNATSYYNESANTVVEITHIGGDNIINAIHNAGSILDIFFHNVTYYHSEGVHKTGADEIHPVDGVENSQGATILYQDDREDLQVIDVIVTNDESGEEIFNSLGKELRTGLYGNLTVVLRQGLRPGNYTVNATHPDDKNYTSITNITQFRILPHVDVSVTKTSDKDVYVLGEEAIFTIRVYGVGTNATNVKVKDFLPESFKFVSAVTTNGSYDNASNVWDIGFLPHGASATLTLKVKTTELGTFDNVVNVTCKEKDWDLTNNVDNKTIKVNIYYTKSASVTNISAGEYFEYYLDVHNVGDTVYTDTLLVRDVLPEGIFYTGEYNLTGADLVEYVNYVKIQIWNITNISPGITARITVKVKALKDGVWNNTMYVGNLPPVNATVNVSSSADVLIIKEVSDLKTNNGDLINWTVIVKNEGPSIAMDVCVVDVIPKGVEIFGITNATKGNYNRNNAQWFIGDMAVGETQTLIITTRVMLSNVNITNEATVNSTTPDPNPDNNYDNATTEVSPEGDVGVEKTVSSHEVNHGQVIYWTIVVTNHGPDKATGVFVTDALPGGLEYINSTKSKGKDYNPISGNWYIGDLENNENATLTIYTRATGHNTLINNIATVNSTSVDTNPNNNKAEDYIKIGPEADLELVKIADKHEVVKDGIVIWTITVINHGPNDAIDAYVEDILPAGLEYLGSDSRRYDNNTGRWDIGHLQNGANATIMIVTRVLASNDVIKNYAITNSSTFDPDVYNNDDEDAIKVKTEADVGIVKIVSNKTAHFGDVVTWTVIVTNYGPNVAENVIVTDFLPAGLIISGSPSHSQGHVYVDESGNGIWKIGNLGVGENVTAIINSVINTTDATITNVVKVNTTSHDPDLSNNDAENRTSIPPECDVEVIKNVDIQTPNKGDTVVWTISVINHGPNVARDVVVTDILPNGLNYISHEPASQGMYNHNIGKWDIGDLQVNSRQTLRITTLVSDTGKITNEVNITTSTYETDLDNNHDNESIDVPAIADLAIVKEVSNKTPEYQDLINWTITVTNNGPDTARDVVVNDMLPAGLVYVTHNATKGLYDSVQGIWQINDLLNASSARLIITTRVNVTNTTIVNVAVVSSTTPDPDKSNNEANNTTEVGPSADLAIEKTVSDHGPKKGDEIIWTITVTNNGPDIAVNAVAKDVLPDGLIFIGAQGDGEYNSTNGLWKIGDIEKGGIRVLNISTIVNVTKAIIVNVANVTSDTPDSDMSNNEDNSTIDVGHETDLEVIKTVSNSTPKYGDEITWNITVINNGPDDAIDTVVFDKLPEGLVWINDDGKGAYNHFNGIWTIGTLKNHTNVTLMITTRVNVINANITNVAVVDCDTHDTNPDNNEDNDTITVKGMADLAIVKEVSNKNPRFGEEITWIITVTNNGPGEAYNVTVFDELPSGLIYKSDDSQGRYNSTTGIWNIGTLENTKSRTLVITTIVNITNSTITNVAVVNSTTPDTNESNNKDNDTTDIAPEADLEIIKLVSNSTARKGEAITWTVVVTNNGPDTALNVYVRDVLPNGLDLTDYSVTDGLFDSKTKTWYIPTLANGKSQNLTLTTLVNVTNITLVNRVNVTNDVYDPNETNNKANNTTDVSPEADLEVIKTAMNSTVKMGDVVVWNITIINHGPDTVSKILVADNAQNGLIFIDGEGNPVGSQLVYDQFNVTLGSGESTVLYVMTLVNMSNVNLTNKVLVIGDIHDPNMNNNNDNDTVEVVPQANIVVEKFVSSNMTKTGEIITWTVVVTNNGPDTAVNTRVSDKLPAELIYAGHDASVGNYDPINGVWIVGDLANGGSEVLEISTIVNVTNMTVVNVANVTSDTPGNRTNGTNKTTSEPKADLVIVKVVSDKNPSFGDIITWTVTVTNNGPDAAINTRVTDQLPDGLVFIKSDGAYDNGTGVWTVGDLANGESKSLVITTFVNVTNATIENVAVGTSDTPGNSTPGDNTTDVDPMANLEVVKFVSNPNAVYGEIITWTIIVTNNGPDTAVNTRVSDKLPAELIYAGHDATVGNYDSISGVWIVGDLTSGASETLQISTIVNVTNMTVVNVANVTSDTPGNRTNGTDNTTSGPKADLVVVKVVSDKNPSFGDVITWTITVTNNGPDAAINTRVTDQLPDGLVFISSDGRYDVNTGIWTVGDLANGESRSLIITTRVNVTNATIENVATVTSDTPGNSTPGENTTDVEPIADLEIVKLVSNTTAKSGEIITWTIIVTNNGPDVAKNVNVTDILPDGLTYRNHEVNHGVYDNSQGIWIVGDMNNGQSYTLTINTEVVIANGTVENVAVANSSTPDNNTDNNRANNNTTVNEDADLVIVKVVSNANPHFGEVITWTITVTNNGPSDAKNVVVTDVLPDGLVFRGSNGAYNPQSGEWIIGDLANGESISLVITTLVNITNKAIVNVANVSSDTPDSNETNNGDNETVNVPAEADLDIVKSVSNSTPSKGDIITWTITVTNNGPDDAVNVRIVDTVPEGLVVIVDGIYVNTNVVTFEVPLIEVGKSREFVLQTLVNVSDANITNIAVVDSTTHDPNDDNNEDNETVSVPGEADLEVVKLVSNSTAHKGDIVTWTVVVTNNGPGDARNVYVTDVLPDGLIYIAHASEKGLFDSNRMLWFIESLNNGESQTLTIETRVNVTNAKITNVVNVTSDTPDSDKSNNVANNTTDVPPEADIGVVKEVNATECVKDQIVEWKITMTNNGPDGAENVVVKDNLPDTLIFISANGNYNPETGIWTIDYLASGETRVLTIITKVNTTGMVIVNNVTATSGVYDPDMENNRASNSTVVKSVADLEVNKVVSAADPHNGDVVGWTITVVNHGPDAARDVTVSDVLPDGLELVSYTGNYDVSTGVWTVGDIENGASVSLEIVTKVVVSNANITNVASVNSTTPDSNPNNNRDNDTVEIVPEADIKVVKTVSNPKPGKGDVITWTIVVSNVGPDAAQDVKVQENLPEGLILISARGSTGSFKDGIWTIGTLNNGEIATLTLTTKVGVSGGIIENVVVASTSTYDPNMANNVDREVITPKEASADLELIKVADKTRVRVGDNIVWIITVINHGPDRAKNVEVTDLIDGDVEFVDAKVSKGSFDSYEGIWDIGDLENGEKAVLILVTKALKEGEVVNYAEVTSDTPDPNEDNNADEAHVDVEGKVTPHPSPDAPVKHTPSTMHATGNPIVMVLFALLALAGVALRRKN